LISIADNYAYPQLVWGIYVERVSKPKRGAVTDEAKIAAAIPNAKACLKAISDLMADNPWLAGRQLTLADLYAAAMFDYLLMHQKERTWSSNSETWRHGGLISPLGSR
jgi:glutathione S-transferase